MRAATRSAIALVVWLAACLSVPPSATARLIFEANDPAFNGATVVSLTANNFGLNPANPILNFVTVQNGVQFSFSTLASEGIFSTGPPGIFRSVDSLGIAITIDPPVSAIGFNFVEAECSGAARFTGAAGSEQFTTLQGQRNLLIGAADIGDISMVTLSDPSSCGFAGWSGMRFVPSTGAPPPAGQADLALEKGMSPVGGPPPLPTGLLYSLRATNQGPDTAEGARIIDFLPPLHPFVISVPPATLDATGGVATILLPPTLLPNSATTALLRVNEPPFGQGLFCGSASLNVAVTTATTPDPNGANNVDVAVKFFDDSSRAGFPEICDNGIDDNCNGRTDCFDPACGLAPNCVVAIGSVVLDCSFLSGFTVIPGLPLLTTGADCLPMFVGDPRDPAPGPGPVPACTVPAIKNDGSQVITIRLPPFCCEPPPPTGDSTLLIANCGQSFRDQLPAGFRAGASIPLDPNFKASVPSVNFLGFGYTEAGATITYHVHYENIGTGDAHDVSIIDVLHPGLDDTTLVVSDTATYDPANRALIWRDPVVPPATPRSVSFSAAVRSDAVPGSKIVNVGTIIFPDAVPPSRIDTNAVEHVVTKPGQIIAPDLKVARCQEIAPGSGRRQVALVNEGFGFAYNAMATIVGAPASVQVTDGVAAMFSHPDDPPGAVGTIVPLAVTVSADTVAFTTQAAGDPCDTLLWRIQWQDGAGASFTRDVQSAPDADADGVADGRDNCPATFNPAQADANRNGIGDACDSVEPPRDTTPPTIQRITASPGSLWPPNHKLVAVTVHVHATDDSGATPACRIVGVSSNEPVLGQGDGDTQPDWLITGDLTLKLRAERSGQGRGRVYTITIQCTDASSNTAVGTTTVTVAHDQHARAPEDECEEPGHHHRPLHREGSDDRDPRGHRDRNHDDRGRFVPVGHPAGGGRDHR